MEWFAVGLLVLWLMSKAKKKKSLPKQTKPYQSDSAAYASTATSMPRRGSPARWIKADEQTTIGHITLTSGLIYVGNYFDAQQGFSNCLIDPSLSVAKSTDSQFSSLSYWPSYSNIQASERRIFLEWLADGRKDPAVNIGYVFMFFYGLERRLFLDNALNERYELTSEVRRLLSIYGDNKSFKEYAGKFLDAAGMLDSSTIQCPPITTELCDSWEMPQSVKLYLGTKISENHQMSAADCLLWVLTAPGTQLRTASRRCFKELQALWLHRFNNRYANGFKISVPKTKLSLEYKSATGFVATLNLGENGKDLPDITATSAPLDKLRDIIDECTTALDPYSRLIGRSPEAANTMTGIMLLPPELSDPHTNPTLMRLKADIATLMQSKDANFVNTKDILSLLEISVGESFSKAQAVQIGQLLDKLDIGLEPDIRYGPIALSPITMAYLFKSVGGAAINPDAALYMHYRTMVEVTALASASDGAMAEQEFEILKGAILSEIGLNQTEKLRLFASAASMWKDLPKQQAVLKRLSQLPNIQKRKAADAAITAVLADGVVAPGEVRFLEKLYKALGLPIENVYTDLHRNGSDEPVSILPETINQNDKAIPAQPTVKQASIQLDVERLKRIKADTATVSSLLADIFVEEEVITRATAPVKVRSAGVYAGLDSQHGELLDLILGQSQISRGRFEEMARTLKLLPDGAFETINEWAFDKFDEPLLEGEDTIIVTAYLAEQLRGTRAA